MDIENPLRRQICIGVLVFALPAPLLLAAERPVTIEVYLTPTCTCCGEWVEYLRKAGFAVTSHVVDRPRDQRRLRGLPEAPHACHTAFAEGYLLEGHIPVEDISRLLRERPHILGLIVTGMPPGTPGMEHAEPPRDPETGALLDIGGFSVEALMTDGTLVQYSSHAPYLPARPNAK